MVRDTFREGLYRVENDAKASPLGQKGQRGTGDKQSPTPRRAA